MFAMSPMSGRPRPRRKWIARRPSGCFSLTVKDLPDVPTFAEAGFPRCAGRVFGTLVALSKTPAAVRQRLNEESTKVPDSGARSSALAP